MCNCYISSFRVLIAHYWCYGYICRRLSKRGSAISGGPLARQIVDRFVRKGVENRKPPQFSTQHEAEATKSRKEFFFPFGAGNSAASGGFIVRALFH